VDPGGRQIIGDSSRMESDATLEGIPAEHSGRFAECCLATKIARA